MIQPSELQELMTARRSNILIDANTSVEVTDITALCNAAMLAPNHKRTWPLRLGVVQGDARSRLGELIADIMASQGDDPLKSKELAQNTCGHPLSLFLVHAMVIRVNDREKIATQWLQVHRTCCLPLKPED